VNDVEIVVTDPVIKQQLLRDDRTVASIRRTSLAAFGEPFNGRIGHSVLQDVRRWGYANVITLDEGDQTYVVVAVQGGQMGDIARELTERLRPSSD
jgi:hypothetical protein